MASSTTSKREDSGPPAWAPWEGQYGSVDGLASGRSVKRGRKRCSPVSSAPRPAEPVCCNLQPATHLGYGLGAPAGVRRRWRGRHPGLCPGPRPHLQLLAGQEGDAQGAALRDQPVVQRLVGGLRVADGHCAGRPGGHMGGRAWLLRCVRQLKSEPGESVSPLVLLPQPLRAAQRLPSRSLLLTLPRTLPARPE